MSELFLFTWGIIVALIALIYVIYLLNKIK